MSREPVVFRARDEDPAPGPDGAPPYEMAGRREERVPLIDFQNLDGWVVEGAARYKDGDEEKPVWSVEDGMIVCAGKGFGFLRFDRTFCDFTLHLEFRMSPNCNSGIGIRTVKFTGPARTNDLGVRAFLNRLRCRDYQGALILEQWPRPPTLLVEAENRLRALLANG